MVIVFLFVEYIHIGTINKNAVKDLDMHKMAAAETLFTNARSSQIETSVKISTLDNNVFKSVQSGFKNSRSSF